MSYSFITEPTSIGDAVAAVETAWAAQSEQVHTPEHELLVATQCAALAAIAAAPKDEVAPLGDLRIRVSLGGHANPGFEEREGWSDTWINLTINQVKD